MDKPNMMNMDTWQAEHGEQSTIGVNIKRMGRRELKVIQYHAVTIGHR